MFHADEVVPKKLAETKKFAGQKIVQASATGWPTTVLLQQMLSRIDVHLLPFKQERLQATSAAHKQSTRCQIAAIDSLSIALLVCMSHCSLQLEFGGQHAALLCVPKA